jgi:DNA-binding Lrp family transcriptional regulator
VQFLEKLFLDLGAEINGEYSQEQVSGKPKRSAFVFITAESDAADLALEDLRKIDAVKEVYVAHGAYDLVAKVCGESFDSVRDVVAKRIRQLGSVKSALTLTIV